MGRVLKQVSKISGNYGQLGEEKVSEYLAKELPDEYLILNSPRIYHAGETVDIDHIVIGPRGIFAIESKNMHGVVTGGLMGNWVQTKCRGGHKEQVKIGNPANQVDHYAKVVREYLTCEFQKKYGNKLNIRVLPVVVFAHENADLSQLNYTKEGMVGRVRILSVEEMKDYVLTKRKLTYGSNLIEKLAEILIPQDQRDQTGIFHSMIINHLRESFTDRFEIGEEIGRGNFGVVYKGYDKKMDREVAIKKLLSSQQHDREVVDRFLREAAISAKLDHENIVAVYDFFQEDSGYYLVMEYLECTTLEYYLRENKLEFNEVARIMGEICNGLAHAHENNVVHRDLKPANILITTDNRVKISDFGIARLGGAPMLTQTHTSLGTPFAMSPEQILGKEVDYRSDIFALGVLLYYLVTGALPFKGENIGEVIYKVLRAAPEPPRKLNLTISPALEKVILKALEKDPQIRYQTIGEFLTDLNNSFDPANVANILLSPEPLWRKLPKFLWFAVRETFINHEKRFKFVSALTVLFFFGVFTNQAYRDSQAVMPTQPNAIINKVKTANFSNENVEILYNKPEKYKGSSVDLTGRVDNVLSQVQSQYLLSVKVETHMVEENNHIVVVYKGETPNLRLESNFIAIKGFVKGQLINPATLSIEPLIEAKQVEIVPVWVVLSPAIKTVNVNKTIDHYESGRKLTLNKVELAHSETRLFVDITNETEVAQVFSFSETVGKQGRKVAKLNYYRNERDLQYTLGPGQTISTILVLDKLSIPQNNAVFSVGSRFFGDSPYFFEVKW